MKVFLETPRLILRQFTVDDVENLCELDRDPDVMRFINGGVPTARDVIHHQVLPRFLAYYEKYTGYGFWAVVEKLSQEFIGWFHFRPVLDDTREIDLGYRLRQAAWGKGYATEGARALITKGFTELGTQRVIATALAANTASIRVMEKAGLQFEKKYLHDTNQEAVQYALNKEDFRMQDESTT
jgi:RimJ/RimL family protein N-acetyltransferase